MPSNWTAPAALALAMALTTAAGTTSAAVITNDPVLPPETGIYVGTNGGAGCFVVFNVCANPGALSDFHTISSTFDASGQELLFNATLKTTMTALDGTPLGTMTFTGDLGETVFGRTSPTATGTWTTQITSLDLDGMLTGPLAGVSGGISIDPAQTSGGETSIIPLGGKFMIDSSLDIFAQLTLNTDPPVIVDRGPLILQLIPEPGTLALLTLSVVALLWQRRSPTPPN